MDIMCQGCFEPWDLYGLVHDEKIFELEGTVTGGCEVCCAEWEFCAPAGIEEAKEGHFLLTRCPCCTDK